MANRDEVLNERAFVMLETDEMKALMKLYLVSKKVLAGLVVETGQDQLLYNELRDAIYAVGWETE